MSIGIRKPLCAVRPPGPRVERQYQRKRCKAQSSPQTEVVRTGWCTEMIYLPPRLWKQKVSIGVQRVEKRVRSLLPFSNRTLSQTLRRFRGVFFGYLGTLHISFSAATTMRSIIYHDIMAIARSSWLLNSSLEAGRKSLVWGQRAERLWLRAEEKAKKRTLTAGGLIANKEPGVAGIMLLKQEPNERARTEGLRGKSLVDWEKHQSRKNGANS